MGPLSREQVVEQLDTMLKSSLKKSYSQEDIKAFIKNNRKLLSSALGDHELSEKLKSLSHKIDAEFSDSVLAFEIHNIAHSLIMPKSGETPEMPGEIWQKIAEHTGGGDFSAIGAMKSVSREIQSAAEKAEGVEVEKRRLSLKKVGCKNANEAIEYAIKHNLSAVNLSEFPDVEMRHLEELFEKTKNVQRLALKTEHPITFTKWPENLKALSLSCPNLQPLPPLPSSLESLTLNNATSQPMLIQGPFPHLQSIKIVGESSRLDGSPMPKLQYAEINLNSTLADLPDELPELTDLSCENFGTPITRLPKQMPKIKELFLHGRYAEEIVTAELRDVVNKNGGTIIEL